MGSIFHEMTDTELDKQLDELRREVRELRFTFASVRSLQNPARVKRAKRDIAAIHTVREERARGISDVKPKSERKGKKGKPKAEKAPAKAREETPESKPAKKKVSTKAAEGKAAKEASDSTEGKKAKKKASKK